jgi:hypothetical protein
MNMTAWIVAVVGTLALAYLVRESLGHLLQRTFALLYGLLNDMVGGLAHARTAALTFWHEHFGPAFGVRPIVGGAILVAVWGLLTLADFKLLMLTIDSLVPAGEEAWRVEIAGYSLTAGQLTAIAVIAFEFFLGMMILDLLGLTDFFPGHKAWSSPSRKTVAAACLAILVLMCAAQAGLAIWRTAKMEEAGAAIDSEQLSGTSGDEQSLAPGPASGSAGWVDRIPLPAMALLNFFLPLAAAGAAGGLYPVLVGGLGAVAAVAVLLPLLLAVVVMTLVRNAIGYAAEVVMALFSVLTAPGQQIDALVRGQQSQPPVAETRHDGGAVGQNPAHQTETMTPPRDTRPETAERTPAATEEGTLADVVAALDRNPLRMSDEDLAASAHRSHNGGRPQ